MVAAAAGKSGIVRRLDTERRVVARRGVQVVDRDEVSVPTAEVRSVDRHSREDLVLNAER
jgi:hypothetical protein